MATEAIEHGCADCGDPTARLDARGLCAGCASYADEAAADAGPLRVLAVDVSAIYWTAWHSSADEEVSAAYSRTVRQIRDEAQNYDRVALCCDSPRRLRNEEFAAYKANRPPKPAGALAQYRRTLEELGRHWPVYEAEGYEGDDVIASLATWAVERNRAGHDVRVTIYSADKDLHQLLCPVVEILNHQTGKRFDAESLEAKAGIRPTQVPDYLALVGDAADNLPGVDKCGPKMAATLLQRFGCLEGIMDAVANHVTEVRALPRVGPALIAALAESTRRSPTVYEVRDLIRLRTPEIDFGRLLQEPAAHSQEETTMADDAEPTDPGHTTEPPDSAPWTDVAPAEPSQPEEPRRAEMTAPVAVRETPPPRARAMAHALARADIPYERQLEPHTAKAAWEMAHHLFQSGLFQLRNPQAVFALILAGRSYGLDVVQSIRGVHIIEGKPSTSASLLMALCLRHPECEYFHCVELTARVATFETRRRNAPAPVRMSWTIEEAEAAGLLKKDNWRKYPKAMLRARCIAELARTVYPDACHNTYIPDELGADVVEHAA